MQKLVAISPCLVCHGEDAEARCNGIVKGKGSLIYHTYKYFFLSLFSISQCNMSTSILFHESDYLTINLIPESDCFLDDKD